MKIHTSHPRSARHPRTGKPILPLGRRKDGRLIWPIMGGSEDAGGDDGDGGGKGGDAGGDDGGKGGDAGGDGKGKAADDGKPFPANTPVEDMTDAQQAAYWRHHARQHEGRNKDWAKLGKNPDEVRALIEASKPDSERALEAARNEGRTAALQEANAAIVTTVVETLLPEGKELKDFPILEALDLTKFTKDDGTIDTAKVRTVVRSALGTAADSRTGDTGQGRRGNGKQSARDAGKSEAERRFGTK